MGRGMVARGTAPPKRRGKFMLLVEFAYKMNPDQKTVS